MLFANKNTYFYYIWNWYCFLKCWKLCCQIENRFFFVFYLVFGLFFIILFYHMTKNVIFYNALVLKKILIDNTDLVELKRRFYSFLFKKHSHSHVEKSIYTKSWKWNRILIGLNLDVTILRNQSTHFIALLYTLYVFVYLCIFSVEYDICILFIIIQLWFNASENFLAKFERKNIII